MGKCGSKTKKKAKYGLDNIDESKLIKLAYGDNATGNFVVRNKEEINAGAQAANTLGQAGFTTYNNAHPDKVNWGSNIGSGALSGASLGANPALVAATGGLSIAAGAALGAGVGVVKSVIKKNELEKEAEAKAKADKERQDMINKVIYQGDLAQIQGDPTMIYGRDFSSYTMKYGGINIKPENRGKFTEYLKNTGSTLSEALNSKDPHVRQMANFANNAKHWKHAYGTDNLPIINGKEVTPIYGNTHEEGGVMIAPNVEAEGGEAIYGNKVASNRIGTDQKTIADRVKELGLLKQKYELLAKQSKGENKQKYLDIISKLDKEINTVFKAQ